MSTYAMIVIAVIVIVIIVYFTMIRKRWVPYPGLDNGVGSDLFSTSGSFEDAKKKCLATPGCTGFYRYGAENEVSSAYGRSSTANPGGTFYRLE